MIYYLVFIITGYLLGSFLPAPFFGHLIKKKDIIVGTKDQNPGTANAFTQAGMFCGILTLLCDLGKGFIPVFLCFNLQNNPQSIPMESWYGMSPVGWNNWISALGIALVLLAPVLGHAFPLYHQFQGGKGIATTFGCLLGYAPNLFPALVLAFFFLFFSLVVRIQPHFYRTIVTYICATGIFFVWGENLAQKLGFLLITVLVCVRMHLSTEERGELKVGLLWMH